MRAGVVPELPMTTCGIRGENQVARKPPKRRMKGGQVQGRRRRTLRTVGRLVRSTSLTMLTLMLLMTEPWHEGRGGEDPGFGITAGLGRNSSGSCHTWLKIRTGGIRAREEEDVSRRA